MLIRKCIASLPGLFQNRSFEFTEGLNIIVGKNASGKSFLSRAFADAAGLNLGPRPLLRPEAWENAYLEMEIENSGHRYQLIRNGMKLFSVRHFDRDRVDLLFDGPPRDEDAPDTAGAILESVKNIAGDPSMHDLYTRIDPGSFGAVSFVMAPMDISNNGFPGRDALRRLFLWDTSGFYRLYSSLKNYFGHDAPKAASGAARDSLHSVEGQLRDIEKTIQIMDIRKSKKQKLSRELEQVDGEIKALEREADEITGEKSDLAGLVKKIEAAGAAGEKVREIEAELRRYEELAETVARKEKEITEKFSQFREFNERKKTNLRRLQEIYRKIRDLNASLDDILFSRNSKKRKTHYISFFVFIIFLGIMYLVNISRVPGFDARTQPLVNCLLAGGTALTVALLYLSLFFPRLRKEKERLRTALSDAHDELRAILEENGVALEDTRIESVYEFLLQYFEEYGEYTEKQLELFVQRETLKSDEQLKTLQNEKKSYSLDLRKLNLEIQQCLKSLKHLRVASADEEEIRRQIDHADSLLAGNREKAEDRKRIRQQLMLEIEAAGDYRQESDDLETRKAVLGEKLRALSVHRDCMLYILDTAQGVITRREDRQMERLLASSRDVFNRITHNQYVTIVDETVIRQTITGEPPGAEINPSLFHTVVMSVKIAFTGFLSDMGLSVPMILDDPFVLLDETRGKTLLDTLKEAGRLRQILVFARRNPCLDTEKYAEL